MPQMLQPNNEFLIIISLLNALGEIRASTSYHDELPFWYFLLQS